MGTKTAHWIDDRESDLIAICPLLQVPDYSFLLVKHRGDPSGRWGFPYRQLRKNGGDPLLGLVMFAWEELGISTAPSYFRPLIPEMGVRSTREDGTVHTLYCLLARYTTPPAFTFNTKVIVAAQFFSLEAALALDLPEEQKHFLQRPDVQKALARRFRQKQIDVFNKYVKLPIKTL